MRGIPSILLPFALSLALAASARAGTLVVCAPGYPGSTAEAQPTLDAFAAALANAGGATLGRLGAEYHETESDGVARLRADDATVAMVPLAFYLEHREELGLKPVAQAVAQGGEPSERWTLVAGKGRVANAMALDGFEIVSRAGYSPRFVRMVLGKWGPLPPGVALKSSGAALSALRKAAQGEPVALLADREQAAALATLPFADRLERVVESPALPASVVASVAGRLSDAQADALVAALIGLTQSDSGRAALAALRLDRFVAADSEAIASAERDFALQSP